MATKSLMVVPPGFRVSTAVIDGEPTSVFIAKTHRKKSKVSKKTRDKISAAARRFKVPILSVGANLIPAVQTADWVMKVALNPAHPPRDKAVTGWNAMMAPYTGIKMTAVGSTEIKPTLALGELGKGLFPNVVVWVVRKTGIFKNINTKLSKSRIPISIS